MTLHLSQRGEETEKVAKGEKSSQPDKLKTSDDMVISDPVNSEQTICVKFNYMLNQFEGLPKEWRELLEKTPQQNEIVDIDKSLRINQDKLLMPEEQLVQKITVYEVKPNYNCKDSFIITATNKYDSKTLGGGSSSQRSQSKEASGSSDERGTATIAA